MCVRYCPQNLFGNILQLKFTNPNPNLQSVQLQLSKVQGRLLRILLAVIGPLTVESNEALLMFCQHHGYWGGIAGFTVQLGCFLDPNNQ